LTLARLFGPTCPSAYLPTYLPTYLPIYRLSCLALLGITVESTLSLLLPSGCPFSGPLPDCRSLRQTVLGGSSTWRPLLFATSAERSGKTSSLPRLVPPPSCGVPLSSAASPYVAHRRLHGRLGSSNSPGNQRDNANNGEISCVLSRHACDSPFVGSDRCSARFHRQPARDDPRSGDRCVGIKYVN